MMTPENTVKELHKELRLTFKRLLDASGREQEAEALGVRPARLTSFLYQQGELHLPTAMQLFLTLGFRLNIYLAGAPPYFVAERIPEPTGKKMYRVELSGLARMKGVQRIEAESEEAAVEAVFLQTGDTSWKYEGMVDDTIEGEAYPE
jgi:hypothetical protein